MSHFQQIREEACAANKELNVSGLVLFNFGNLSVADHRNGCFRHQTQRCTLCMN